MAFTHLLAFALASFLLLAIPGPTIIFVISKSLRHGVKYIVPLLVGIGLGDLFAMTGSLLGLGALLLRYAYLFDALKFFCALYLLFLGVSMWNNSKSHLNSIVNEVQAVKDKTFTTAFTITALNPKSIVFFIAFVPQFIDKTQDMRGQIIVFIIMFTVISLIVSFSYAVLAAMMRTRFNVKKIQFYAYRLGGGALMATGAVSAMLGITEFFSLLLKRNNA